MTLQHAGSKDMYDTVEKIGSSTIQHGPYNDRIYLMKLHPEDLTTIVDQLDELATHKGYTKIFVKVPFKLRKPFHARGYQLEAAIPGFYHGHENAEFLAKYPDEKRSIESQPGKIQYILDLANSKARISGNIASTPDEKGIEIIHERDVSRLAEIYRTVFETYPFPIHEESYLLKTMRSNVDYYCIRMNDRIAAVASSEKDEAAGNVEMTDFATLPDYRGRGFALRLLERMEADMRTTGLKTTYTIARALSPGMNITFSKLGYRYGGTLTNNTNISGTIESMNIWYKSL